jgi:hypothetical protein
MADAAAAAPLQRGFKHSAAKLDAHASTAVGAFPAHQRVECPFCPSVVRRAQLDAHVSSQHAERAG